MDIGRRNLALACAAVARFGTAVLLGTAMAVYVGRRGSAFAVGMVLAAHFVGLLFAAPAWGAIADATGQRRATLLVSGVGGTLAILPLVVLDGVWLPIGFRAAYAALAAGFAPVALAVVSERGGANRGRALGRYNGTRAFGFASGRAVAGVLLGLLAPGALYLATAGVSATATLAAVLAVPGGRTATTDRADGGTPGETTGGTDIRVALRAAREAVAARLRPVADPALRRHGLRWLYVAIAIRSVTILGIMSLMPVYLLDLGLSEALMGFTLASNHVWQTPLMPIVGRVADRVGRGPLIASGLAGSGLFALLVASPALGGVPPLPVAVVSMAVLAAAYSALSTGATAFIGDVGGDRTAELMGLRMTAKSVGGIVGPPLIGGVATVVGFGTAFALVTVLPLVAAVLAWIGLSEPRPDDRRAAAVAADD